MTRLPDLNRAARMASRVLVARQTAALPIDPMPILRACRNTRVLTYEEAADETGLTPAQFERLVAASDAFTFRREAAGATQYIVVYRPGGNPARLRFTLAHELGHRLLGHSDSAPAEDREADCFASHLLCPEPVIARLRERFGTLHAEQLAAACYVSPACAQAAAGRPRVQIPEALLAQVADLLASAAMAVEVVTAYHRLHILLPKDE